MSTPQASLGKASAASPQLALTMQWKREPGKPYEIPAAVRELLGEPLAGDVAKVFRHMEIAEERIGQFCERHPEHAQRLDRAFIHLRWQLEPIHPERLFVHHVDELLQRVIDGESLEPATQAEVLAILSYTSRNAPLIARATALFAQLFEEIWGADSPFRGEPPYPEPWPGSSAQLMAELRQRASNDSRQIQERNDA